MAAHDAHLPRRQDRPLHTRRRVPAVRDGRRWSAAPAAAPPCRGRSSGARGVRRRRARPVATTSYPARYGQADQGSTRACPPRPTRATSPSTAAAFELGLPTFAICRGCQIVNVAMGGTLHQDMTTPDGLHRPISDVPEEVMGERHPSASSRRPGRSRVRRCRGARRQLDPPPGHRHRRSRVPAGRLGARRHDRGDRARGPGCAPRGGAVASREDRRRGRSGALRVLHRPDGPGLTVPAPDRRSRSFGP